MYRASRAYGVFVPFTLRRVVTPRRSIPEQEGLLLVPGGSVHTLGMRFNIDVVFLNRQMRVLGVAENVAPWRIVIAPKDTMRVLELAAGKIATTRLTAGTYLIIDRPSDEPSERTDDQAAAGTSHAVRAIAHSVLVAVAESGQKPAALSVRTRRSRSDEAER